MTEGTQQTSSDKTAIHAFQVGFSEAELTELRRRVNATRWPEHETVTDDSQGVRLAMMQELARYWATDYDWRKCEAKLNDLPQFTTEIDGLDIHFIHVRSRYQDALPLIVTHGWPGSIIEQLKIIEPLTNPETHGASAQDAPTSSIKPRAAGPSGRIPTTSSTTTGSTAAATSPPGNSPTCSPPRCGPRSDHCVKGRPS
jgi:hypothetical protein